MFQVSALAMTVALCLQVALNVVLSNDLVDFAALGIFSENLTLAQSGLVIFSRMMGGIFLLSAAQPLAGRSEGLRSIFIGGGIAFLLAAGVNAMMALSALLPPDPMRELWYADDADAWTLRIFYSAIFLICDVMIAIFAICAGVRFRGAMLLVGIIVALLCCVQIAHDMIDIWYGSFIAFDVSLADESMGWLGQLWFDESPLRLRVMSHVDAVAKVLFALLACLAAFRLSRLADESAR